MCGGEVLYLKLKAETQSFILPRVLCLDGYQCSLLELKGQISPWIKGEDLYVCANFIQESIIENKTLPILRQIIFEGSETEKFKTIDIKFDSLVWRDVTRKKIDEIKLYLCDSQGTIPSFDNVTLACTLLCVPDS